MQNSDLGDVVRKEEGSWRRYLSRTAIVAVLVSTIGTLAAGVIYFANTPVRQPRKRDVQYENWTEYYEDRIPKKMDKYGKMIKGALSNEEAPVQTGNDYEAKK